MPSSSDCILRRHIRRYIGKWAEPEESDQDGEETESLSLGRGVEGIESITPGEGNTWAREMPSLSTTVLRQSGQRCFKCPQGQSWGQWREGGEGQIAGHCKKSLVFSPPPPSQILFIYVGFIY